jgi:mycothiol synthase
MNRESLDEQMGLPWYEPDGFLVARSAGALVGFCWTKQHPEAVGEIYLVAVDPARSGGGLGRTLVTAGFASLEARGARTGMLWVDEANAGAVDLYRSLGMEATLANREMERVLSR